MFVTEINGSSVSITVDGEVDYILVLGKWYGEHGEVDDKTAANLTHVLRQSLDTLQRKVGEV